MIPRLDHQKQVQRIGLENRLVALGFDRVCHMTGENLLFTPHGRFSQRCKDIVDQRLNLFTVQFVGKRQQLCGGPAFGNGDEGLFLAQTPQVFRQQRRTANAKAVFAVTDAAMLLVEGFCSWLFGKQESIQPYQEGR